MGDAVATQAIPLRVQSRLDRKIPGEPGLWVFLFGDMGLFVVFFVAYLVERAAHRDVFAASSASMDLTIGFVNTLVLLVSSLLVIIGVGAVRAHRAPLATAMLAGAMGSGLLFVVLKVSEYVHLFSSGYGPDANPYFGYYFTLTGIHLIHVLIGLGLLSLMIARAHSRQPFERRLVMIESGGCFWHMVDLLWMVIFPLLYLVA